MPQSDKNNLMNLLIKNINIAFFFKSMAGFGRELALSIFSLIIFSSFFLP